MHRAIEAIIKVIGSGLMFIFGVAFGMIPISHMGNGVHNCEIRLIRSIYWIEEGVVFDIIV